MGKGKLEDVIYIKEKDSPWITKGGILVLESLASLKT